MTRYNATLDKAGNRSIFQRKKQQLLSLQIRELFGKIYQGRSVLKGLPVQKSPVLVINPNIVRKFAHSFLRNSAVVERIMVGRKLDWRNATRYKAFIGQNLKNVSRVYHTILDWWMKERAKADANGPGHQVVGRACAKGL